MKKFLKRAAVAVATCSPALLFAEGTSEAIDLSPATAQITAMKTALTGFISDNVGTLAAILGSVLVVTLIWVGFKWIRKGANKAS